MGKMGPKKVAPGPQGRMLVFMAEVRKTEKGNRFGEKDAQLTLQIKQHFRPRAACECSWHALREGSRHGLNSDAGRGEERSLAAVFLQSWFSCAQTLPGVQHSGRHRPKALKQTRPCLSARPSAVSAQNVQSGRVETQRT